MIKFTLTILLSLLFTNAVFACFAGNTQIKMADGKLKAVKDIMKGDQVADMSPKSSMEKITQGTADIYFSSGTDESYQPLMVYIDVKDIRWHLIVTREHVFPTASGKFKKAIELNSNDQLISEDGKPVEVTGIRIGTYTGVVQNIASQSDLNPDNLIIANGIWSGTYKHQIYWDMGVIEDSNFFDDFPLNH